LRNRFRVEGEGVREVFGGQGLRSEEISLVSLGGVRGEDWSRLRSERLKVSLDECSYNIFTLVS